MLGPEEVDCRANRDRALPRGIRVELLEVLGRWALQSAVGTLVLRSTCLQFQPGAVYAPTEGRQHAPAVMQQEPQPRMTVEDTGSNHARGEHAHLVWPAECCPQS